MILEYIDLSEKDKIDYIIFNGILEIDYCHCQSGEVYKFCCKNIEQKKYPTNYPTQWQAIANNKLNKGSFIQENTCLFPDCNLKAIKSHAVQRNKYLNLISNRKNEVCKFQKSQNNNTYYSKIIREKTNTATTFWGYCKKHDNEIFKNIECQNSDIDSIESIYAHTYRSISKEYIRKMNKLELIEKDHFIKFNWLYSNEIGSGSNLDFRVYLISTYLSEKRDCLALKKAMDNIVLNYDDESHRWDINNEVLKFSKKITIATDYKEVIFLNTQIRKTYDGLLKKKDVEIFSEYNNQVVSLIILPSIDRDEYNIVLATYDESQKSNDIIEFFNSSSEIEKKNIINNLLIDNIGDVYFSQKKIKEIKNDDNFTLLQHKIINGITNESSSFKMKKLSQKPFIEII